MTDGPTLDAENGGAMQSMWRPVAPGGAITRFSALVV